MDIANKISKLLNVSSKQVVAAIGLFEEENTIPFIARYRKEATGNLDEEQLRVIQELYGKYKVLVSRRETVINSIREQGKLTPDIEKNLLDAETLTALEDIYLPYKPKRRTRASIARENGLQPLADLIIGQAIISQPISQLAMPFLNEKVISPENAWDGARDIVAEAISEHPEIRKVVREKALSFATIKSEKIKEADDPQRMYELYYEFEQRVDRIRPHQVLAINRGEREKVLRVKVLVSDREWMPAVENVYKTDSRSPFAEMLRSAGADSAERLLLPAIDRDVRRELTEVAGAHATGVFTQNLRALLSQPPLIGRIVMGIDPGFRTGCKVAVVDETGKLLDTVTIYPHPPQKDKQKSLTVLSMLVERYQVELIAIGNGTASRETEQLAVDLIHLVCEKGIDLFYLIVNEAGASVYSASPLAREELPGLDVSLRGAVSIARRVQDPLAELVKIDPKSIGVGMYQHDINQINLDQAVTGVVESVVNRIGVDANTASVSLLNYVSGIGPKLAQQIVDYRNNTGSFKTRNDLHRIPKFGAKVFEQAAGFMRIYHGDNLLDTSAIHPESYFVANEILKRANLNLLESKDEIRVSIENLKSQQSMDNLAKELSIGVPTLQDIFEQLVQPGRDPREDLPLPILRSDVVSIESLTKGMRLKGTVRNVVDFGAFVDIGVKQDGLLHRSKIPSGYSLRVGDIILVEILDIEIERNRIALGFTALEPQAI